MARAPIKLIGVGRESALAAEKLPVDLCLPAHRLHAVTIEVLDTF